MVAVRETLISGSMNKSELTLWESSVSAAHSAAESSEQPASRFGASPDSSGRYQLKVTRTLRCITKTPEWHLMSLMHALH